MAGSQTGRPLTIGAVLAALREDFPDLTISKIRFLESEGLVEPQRSPSGYRHYRPEDVARLRYVLSSQRDHFWPLKVIRESLDALDRGLTPAPEAQGRPQAPQPTVDPDLAETDFQPGDRTLRLTRAELLSSAQATPELVDTLIAAGLIGGDGRDAFDENDLRVVHAASGLARFGIEPRHLRPFRTVADREVGLVDQATRGRPAAHRDEERREVARLCLQLHAALLKAGLTT